MALHSKCPKCESTSFELVEETPKDSAFKLMFVRCSKCGSVVGVLDYLNIGDSLLKVAHSLNKRLDELEHIIRNLR